MLWKIAALKSLKFTIIVLIASTLRFIFNPEINWYVQIATAVFVFLVAMIFFYFQVKRNMNPKNGA